MYPTAIVALVEINRSISDNIENSLSNKNPTNIHPEVERSDPLEGNHASDSKEQEVEVENQPSRNSYA
jgi:hypothetical protein